MTDIETTSVSEQGFVSSSQVGDYELTIDATNEEGPNPNQVLVADYAACFLPAFRVGGQQRDHDDLGQLQIDAEAELDDEDDISSISFDIHVEADLDDGELEGIADSAEDICHVHTALRDELTAEIDVHGDAF